MEFLSYALIIAVVWSVGGAIYKGFKSGMTGDDGRRHCMTCGMEAEPKTVTKGSLAIEILLWLCFLVPGLIYSIWRLTSRHQACPSCNGTTLVPIDSPAAVNQRKILQQGAQQ